MRRDRGGFNATNVDQFQTTISFEDALSRIDSLRLVECGESRVSVGFFGSNSDSFSDTLFANFRFSDNNTTPLDTVAPSDLSLTCSSQSENLMINWIRNGGGAVLNDACKGEIPWVEFEWQSGTRSGRGTNATGPFDDIINEAVCDQVINFTFIGRNACEQFNVSQSAVFTLMLDSSEVQIDSLPSDLVINCTETDINIQIASWLSDLGGTRASSLISSTLVNPTISEDSVLNRVSEFQATGCDDYQIQVGFSAVDTFSNTSDTVFAIIQVIDDEAPMVSIEAKDSVVVCRENNIETILENWIRTRGGAMADDNCSDTVIWSSFSWTGEGRSSRGNFESGPFDNILNSSTCSLELYIYF